ncbi:MAG: CPBP family glutamic-type intramembrane protease [Sphingomicrobium sp.]
MRDVAARPVDWRAPISYLPRVLLEPRRPMLALAIAWLVVFVPTLALGAIVSAVMPPSALPTFPAASWYVSLLIVVIGPVIETLIMGGALILLSRFLSPTAAVLVSAAGWGIAHSTAAPGWGLVIWWPFVIFSTLFVTWRKRSTMAAIAMAASAHAMHNLLPALMLVSGLES